MATLLHMPLRVPALPSPLRGSLTHVLGTRAKVGVLRVLSAGGDPMTQRELARRAAIQHRSTQAALEDLVALEVVHRLEGGRDFLVSLNSSHHLTPALQELFRTEQSLFADLRTELLKAARTGPGGRQLRSLALFGSAARSADTIGSDLDILVVTADAASREKALAGLLSQVDRLRSGYGVRLAPVAYALAQARHRWRRKLAPFPQIARDAIVLFGPPLPELLGRG